MWCVAELDEACIAQMEDMLALYEKPYKRTEPVLCLDEKPVSLHADVRPGRPPLPGHAARRDNEYKRCGTANIFAVVEPKAGRHFNRATPNRSGQEFALTIRDLAAAYPLARRIHLVMDNLNIHCRKSLTDSFGPQPGRTLWNRFKVHYTPKHGSWLNQAEIELSLLSRQCLGRRRIPAPGTLSREIRAWNARANRNRTRIEWNFTRKAARNKFGYKQNLFRRSKTWQLRGRCISPIAHRSGTSTTRSSWPEARHQIPCRAPA